MERRSTFLPPALPSFDNREEEALLRILRSGWITTGKETAAFENEFARYVGAKHAIAINSCTSALYLSLRALNIGAGDEVIIPSLTWPATANVVEETGATTKFCDIEYSSANVTADTIAAAISPRTKAIVVVHYAGVPCDMDSILDLARRHDIPVIEDAAHAIGATYREEKIGRPHGVIACFSFHPAKNMTTAEGAMMTVESDALAQRIKTLKFHGVNRDAWSRYGTAGVSLYDVSEPSLKFNLPDLLSALGRVQLQKVDSFNARRAQLCEIYYQGLESAKGIELPPRATSGCSHLFAIRVSEEASLDRGELAQKLGELNVGTSLHFLPVHTLSYYRARYPEVNLPNAERFGRNTLSLPLFPQMSDDDVHFVCKAVLASLMVG